MENFGEYIRSQRELRQVTREEVSSVTKVSLKYLDALEYDKSEYLPSRPYVIGFLRVYSKYLGLDDDAIVTRYIASAPDANIEEIARNSDLKKKRIAKIMLTSAFVFFIVLASLLIIRII